MQFITGIYLFAGLTLFGTLRTPALYMAALAFTAYGAHWFALGSNRLRRAHPRVNVGITVAFLLISILGIIVFFNVGDDPVGGLFIGLACVYAADFFASFGPSLPGISGMAERVQGFFQIGTGFWLMYLVFAVALNFVLGYTLPLLARSRPTEPAGVDDDLRTAVDPPAALAAPRPSFPRPHARPATTTRRFALSPNH
jgi:hypothetical protein